MHWLDWVGNKEATGSGGESGIVRHVLAVMRVTRLITTAEGASSAEAKGFKYLVSSVQVRQD